jgi:hypothetical protein
MRIEEIDEIGEDCKYLIDCGNYELIRNKRTLKFLDKRCDKNGKRTHSITIGFRRYNLFEMDIIEQYYNSKHITELREGEQK